MIIQIAGAVAAVVALNVFVCRKDRDGHWHPWRDKMRRRIKDEWQVREMTKAEALDDYDSRQW